MSGAPPAALDPLPERPLVSALLTVQDGERFLPDSIGSILGQDYEPIELIVVDNGSTDDGYGLARRLAPGADVSRHTAALGFAGAWNEAIGRARGRLLAPLDADDVWPAGRTSALIAELRGERPAGLVFGELETFHCPLLDEGERARLPRERPATAGSLPGTAMLRREVAERTGPWRAAAGIAAFGEWLMRIRAQGWPEVRHRGLVLRHRLHTASLTFRARHDNRDYARAMALGLRSRGARGASG